MIPIFGTWDLARFQNMGDDSSAWWVKQSFTCDIKTVGGGVPPTHYCQILNILNSYSLKSGQARGEFRPRIQYILRSEATVTLTRIKWLMNMNE